jgi:hypothetical protein
LGSTNIHTSFAMEAQSMSSNPLPRLSRFVRPDVARDQRRRYLETASGEPDPPPDCPREQLFTPGLEILEPPSWFREMVQRGQSPEEVMVVLRQRVFEGEDRHVAKLIVNTIARLPGGSAIVKRMVTQELFSELFRLSQEDSDAR